MEGDGSMGPACWMPMDASNGCLLLLENLTLNIRVSLTSLISKY